MRPARSAGVRYATPGSCGTGPGRSSRAGRRGCSRRPGQAMPGCFAVRPGDEVLDPGPQSALLQGPGALPGELQVVGMVVEEQVPIGDHALQDADGVDDRGDGDPGHLALAQGPSPIRCLRSSSLSCESRQSAAHAAGGRTISRHGRTPIWSITTARIPITPIPACCQSTGPQRGHWDARAGLRVRASDRRWWG